METLRLHVYASNIWLIVMITDYFAVPALIKRRLFEET